MSSLVVALPYQFDLRRFDNIVDWFIHPTILVDKNQKKQARLFILSHLFGPFLGNGTALIVVFADPSTSYRLFVPIVAISGFWLFPFLLRWFGKLELLAMTSIQTLTFCILWVTFFFGGAASPFLPWTVTIPLLAFFYVGDSRTMRIAIFILLTVNAAGFYVLNQVFVPPEHGLSPELLQQLGLISTAAISVYVTMMALYYAKALASQAELETMMRSHMATASALRLAARQAERASTAKVEFLAKMSHELRTPLNAIIGYSQMLLEEPEDAQPDELEDLGKIQTSGQHLLKLVNGILDLARIESGKAELYNEKIALDELVRDIVAGVAPANNAQGNRFEVDLDPTLTAIVADRTKLTSAVSNVVENAVKYTRGGTITVSTQRLAEAQFGIVIADTGIGIGPEYLDTIFEQFAVSDEQTTTRYGGTGLGLALSCKLCRMMGGTISVESTLGRGSRFTLTLPIHPTDELQPPTAPPIEAAKPRHP